MLLDAASDVRDLKTANLRANQAVILSFNDMQVSDAWFTIVNHFSVDRVLVALSVTLDAVYSYDVDGSYATSALASGNGTVASVPRCDELDRDQRLGKIGIRNAVPEADLPPALASSAKTHNWIRTCFENEDCIHPHLTDVCSIGTERRSLSELKGGEK